MLLIAERQLIARLVAESRSFVKVLRCNWGAQSTLARAMLTERGGVAPVLRHLCQVDTQPDIDLVISISIGRQRLAGQGLVPVLHGVW